MLNERATTRHLLSNDFVRPLHQRDKDFRIAEFRAILGQVCFGYSSGTRARSTGVDWYLLRDDLGKNLGQGLASRPEQLHWSLIFSSTIRLHQEEISGPDDLPRKVRRREGKERQPLSGHLIPRRFSEDLQCDCGRGGGGGSRSCEKWNGC